MATEVNVHFEGGDDDEDRDEDQNEQKPPQKPKPAKKAVSRMRKPSRPRPKSKPTPVAEQASIPQLDLTGDNSTVERVPINPPNITSVEIETEVKEPLPPPKDLPTDVEFEKKVDKAVKQLSQEAKRELTAQKREERKALKREMQDAKRAQRIESKEASDQASLRRTQIRSNAVTGRIQAYSIASAVGLPGYVTAAIADTFFTRPREERQISAERQYTADYADYEQKLEDHRISQQRQREDNLDARSPTPVNRDQVRESLKNTGIPGAPTNPPVPTSPPGTPPSPPGPPSSPPTPGSPNPNTGLIVPPPPVQGPPGPGTGISVPPGQPPTPPGSGWPKGWNQWGTIGPPNPPGNGPTPPPPGPGPKPGPPPPPPFPNIPTPWGMIVTGVVKALQETQKAGANAINKIGETASGSLNDSPTVGLKAINKNMHSLVDPLGITTPIVVAGFDQLLSLTEDIKTYSMKDIQFSPKTLQASIEGDISKLLQSIDLAAKNDPLKAEFVRASTQFEMAWEELRAQVFEIIAPVIIPLMHTMVLHLKAAANFLNLLQLAVYTIAGNIPVFGMAIRQLLNQIQNNTAPPVNNVAKSGILKQVEDFMNPNNFQGVNRRNIPNPVF